MKTIFNLFILVFSLNVAIANNDRDKVLNNARALKEAKDYKAALKEYIEYIKLFKNETVNLTDVYFEVANCYSYDNNLYMASKVVKETVSKFGATKEDMQLSKVLDPKVFELVWSEMGNQYTSLRKDFVKKLKNVDLYVEKSTIVMD